MLNKTSGFSSDIAIRNYVTYKDNTDVYHPDAVVATNNTTAVTLLDAPSEGVVNIVELIKVYNPDTQANTVQILANDTVIYTYT